MDDQTEDKTLIDKPSEEKKKSRKPSEIKTLFKKNKSSIFYFELLYVLVGVFFIYPLLILTYKASIALAGYQIITVSNIIRYLFKPFTLVLLAIMAFVWTFYLLFQITALILAFDKRCEGLSGLKLIYNAFIKTISFVKKKTLAFFIILCIIIPIMSLTVYGNNIINLVSIVIDIIPSNALTNLIIGIIAIVAVFGLVQIIFIFHRIILEEDKAKEAIKNSTKIVRTNFFEIVTKFLKLNIVLIVISFIGYFIIEVLLVTMIKAFANKNISLTVFLSIMYGLNLVLKYVVIILFIVLNIAMVSSLFNKYNDSENTIELHEVKKSFVSVAVAKKIILAISGVFLISISILFFVFVRKGAINMTGLYNIVEVTAHRGSSKDAPENTLSAFELSIEAQADSIELDVQLTKDNYVVVCHDEYLSRVSSSNARVSDLTLEEIKQIDVGSFFSQAYKEETIPTLEEVLLLVDGKCQLNIEIKVYNNSYGYLEKFAEKIDDVIDENDAYYWCYFSSFNGQVLSLLKDLSSRYTIGLITSTGLSNYKNLIYDFISINTIVVDLELVKAIHKAGLKVHVWTVDSSSRIVELINIGVDNIITNAPINAKNIIYAKKSDYIIQQTFSWFFDQSDSIYELITS